ncbi:acetyl-CoA C-acetyltransferase [Chitinophaga terrae (ex Kim and Jung 2007)]|uniref:acetyl-CoA C-acetyltransferase n=1 Tax=Chitinophaga terrae (ex Kim and Jung 2007) TaxID=408074 RepID=A0A1H4G066_9BACT|nr:acetyl-CoA C-acyltransferase [Chitinophaga terrae (ex Kim and Jung 2007)]GEP92932.1 acetyl-CoA acetyltransferase [Chitinophaga terrae (ex Kim and Jung 2007)]SEB02787.1 acetyl-CoA C-acetyltransferase [Chitinophaga terrae (ex Kim and Jung 2007)]
MKEVFIVSSVRTPIGSFNGALSGVPATRLGSVVIKAALERANVKPDQVNEVYMGNVISANLGQAPANQASLGAGIPDTVPCTTVNKVCASGMKAIMLGAQSIMLGDNDIVVAGGMENMSAVPYYLDKARNGYKLGHGTLTDGIIRDGLWDPYHDYHMGNAAELCAKEYNISREEQDAYATESYKRAAAAWQEGLFNAEVVPVEVPGKQVVTVTEDEDYKKVIFEKIPSLKPSFQKDGTITAANASNINDGAAAVVLVSGEKVKELGLKPLAKIISFADASQAPEWFTTTPVKAIQKALDKAGKKISDVDYMEVNEAFSVVPIANARDLGISLDKVNIWGGGVSMGHPIGCSGARIVTTLNSILHNKNATLGVAGICNGGGGASAIVIERV